MPELQAGALLRIYIREGERFDGGPLQDAVLDVLRKAGIGGATVMRGVTGYGADGKMHETGWLSFGAGLPLVIEAVDTEANLAAVVPKLEAMLTGGLITMSAVEFHHYKTSKP